MKPAPEPELWLGHAITWNWAVTGLFLLALTIRLMALAVLGPRLSNDSQIYLIGSEQIARGGLPVLLELPLDGRLLYSLLLTLLGALLRPSLVWAACISQAVLGALTAAIICASTTRVTRSTCVGLLAGLITALHVTFVFWGVYLLTDTLLLFILAVCLDRLFVLVESSHVTRNATWAGLAAIGLALTRQLTAPFVVVLPTFAIVVLRGRKQRMGRALLGFAAAVLLLTLPIAVATLVRGPSRPSLASRASLVFWQGVYIAVQWNEQGRGTYGVDIVDLPPVLDVDSSAELFRARSLERMQADPTLIWAQIARKARVYWSPFLPEYSFIHKVGAALYFIPFFVLSVVGLISSRKNVPLVTVSVLGIVVFSLASIFTVVDYDLRYRLPVEFLMVPLCAAGLYSLGRLLLIWPRGSS